MSSVQLCSSAMLQQPAFAAAATRSIGQVGQIGNGSSAVSDSSAIKLTVPTSLTGNIDSLKAQSKALDLLDSVLGAAQSTFQQIAPLLPNGATSDSSTSASNVDAALRAAKYGSAPLFDASVHSGTVGALMQSSQNNLSIFSPEVRGTLQSAFESAFDIYA